MTNEELEREVKRLEEQITNLRIKILESKAEPIPYKPYEVEVPEDIENYYYVDADGLIESLLSYSDEVQKGIFKRGLAFKTRAEAEKYDKERILLFKMHKWAEEHNGGWTPDWESSEDKYRVVYNYRIESFEISDAWRFCNFSKLPYFKSEELAELFIKEFGDEIKEVFC